MTWRTRVVLVGALAAISCGGSGVAESPARRSTLVGDSVIRAVAGDALGSSGAVDGLCARLHSAVPSAVYLEVAEKRSFAARFLSPISREDVESVLEGLADLCDRAARVVEVDRFAEQVAGHIDDLSRHLNAIRVECGLPVNVNWASETRLVGDVLHDVSEGVDAASAGAGQATEEAAEFMAEALRRVVGLVVSINLYNALSADVCRAYDDSWAGGESGGERAAPADDAAALRYLRLISRAIYVGRSIMQTLQMARLLDSGVSRGEWEQFQLCMDNGTDLAGRAECLDRSPAGALRVRYEREYEAAYKQEQERTGRVVVTHGLVERLLESNRGSLAVERQRTRMEISKARVAAQELDEKARITALAVVEAAKIIESAGLGGPARAEGGLLTRALTDKLVSVLPSR